MRVEFEPVAGVRARRRNPEHSEGSLLEIISRLNWRKRVRVESAVKRKFNNLQGHGWHKKHCKDMENGLTDRKRIADGLQADRKAAGRKLSTRISLGVLRESKGACFSAIVET